MSNGWILKSMRHMTYAIIKKRKEKRDSFAIYKNTRLIKLWWHPEALLSCKYRNRDQIRSNPSQCVLTLYLCSISHYCLFIVSYLYIILFDYWVSLCVSLCTLIWLLSSCKGIFTTLNIINIKIIITIIYETNTNDIQNIHEKVWNAFVCYVK